MILMMIMTCMENMIFFSFDYKGDKIIAKIDYYDLNHKYMSEDPSNPDITNRVLTIMTVYEY